MVQYKTLGLKHYIVFVKKKASYRPNYFWLNPLKIGISDLFYHRHVGCLSRGIEGTCSKIIFFFPSCFSRFWEKSQKATFYTIIFKIVIFQQFQLVVSVPVSNRETDTAMFLVKMEEAELPLTDGIIFDLSSLYHPVHRPVDRRLQWRKVYASKVVFVDSWSTNCLIWTKYSPQPHQLLPPDLHRVAEIENWDWFKFNIGGVQPEGWLWCNSNTESCRWEARERVSSRPCLWPTWSPPRSSPSPSLIFPAIVLSEHQLFLLSGHILFQEPLKQICC